MVQYKGPLDHRQAMQAKDECLAALKERLLERANIIQQHLNAENQSLHQKKITYKRSTGSGAVEADEEFTKTYEAALFRIDILRARLAKVCSMSNSLLVGVCWMWMCSTCFCS